MRSFSKLALASTLVFQLGCSRCTTPTPPPQATVQSLFAFSSMAGKAKLDDSLAFQHNPDENFILSLRFAASTVLEAECTSNATASLSEPVISSTSIFFSSIATQKSAEVRFHWQGGNYKPGATIVIDAIEVRFLVNSSKEEFRLVASPIAEKELAGRWRGSLFKGFEQTVGSIELIPEDNAELAPN